MSMLPKVVHVLWPKVLFGILLLKFHFTKTAVMKFRGELLMNIT